MECGRALHPDDFAANDNSCTYKTMRDDAASQVMSSDFSDFKTGNDSPFGFLVLHANGSLR